MDGNGLPVSTRQPIVKRIILDRPDIIGPWVAQRSGGTWADGQGTAIGLGDENGVVIGGVLYEQYNGASLVTHIAGVPGTNWMTPRFLQTIFAYPFVQLNVRKIISPVASGNLPSRRFCENLGFTIEATLEEAHPDGSLLLYTMSKQQCRWHNLFERRLHHGKTLRTAAT